MQANGQSVFGQIIFGQIISCLEKAGRPEGWRRLVIQGLPSYDNDA